MRVNRYLLPLFGVVPLVAVVLIAQLTGNWSTSGRDSVDLANMKPEDIKGWMTWQQVSDGFGIPLDELYALAGVPADIPASTALKDMEGLLEGFETTTVREALASYLAGTTVPAAAVEPVQPAASDRATLAPAEAPVAPVPLPTSAPAATAEPPAAGEHIPQNEGVPQGDGTGTGPTPLPPGQVLPASEIKGRHTLADIAQQCAVPLDQLVAALGLPADIASSTEVKDLVENGSVAEVQTVRDAVSALQAAQ